MKKSILALGAALGILLTGCADNAATGGKVFSLMTPSMERSVGDETASAALQQFGLYKPESSVTRYVLETCQRTWAVTEMADQPARCLFLDDDVFNAWATPGYLNVNRGLLPFVQTEAQLMSVLGHEAGHVTARHVTQQQSMGMAGQLLATGALIALAAGTDDDGLVQAGSLAAGVGLNLGMAKYSRTHELQADKLGQRYLERLGYDRREGVDMVRRLQAVDAYSTRVETALNFGQPKGGDGLMPFFASHPLGPQRETAAIAEAGGEPDGSVRLPAGITPAGTAADPVGRARYHVAINGVEYGPSRTFGVAGRTSLTFPKQRFAWQLPEGFVLAFAGHNQKDKVTLWEGGHVPTGVRARFFTAPFEPGMNVANVLKSVMGVSGEPLQRLALKDTNAPTYTEAYTARFNPAWPDFEGKPSRVVAVALPNTGSLSVATFSFIDEAQREREEGAIMASLQHSRFYGETEARNLQRLKISTFQAASGDTVSRRAASMPQGALREEWFRALNGLKESDNALKAGQWYKSVVDVN